MQKEALEVNYDSFKTEVFKPLSLVKGQMAVQLTCYTAGCCASEKRSGWVMGGVYRKHRSIRSSSRNQTSRLSNFLENVLGLCFHRHSIRVPYPMPSLFIKCKPAMAAAGALAHTFLCSWDSRVSCLRCWVPATKPQVSVQCSLVFSGCL